MSDWHVAHDIIMTSSFPVPAGMSYQSQAPGGVGPQKQLVHGVTSTSMVDLPMNYATSTEHLGNIEEYPFPLSSNTAKSQSVPRLTLLTISTETDKSEWVWSLWLYIAQCTL